MVMLFGVSAPKYVLTNCKSCKIVQHGLLLDRAEYSIRSSDVLNFLKWSIRRKRKKALADYDV